MKDVAQAMQIKDWFTSVDLCDAYIQVLGAPGRNMDPRCIHHGTTAVFTQLPPFPMPPRSKPPHPPAHPNMWWKLLLMSVSFIQAAKRDAGI